MVVNHLPPPPPPGSGLAAHFTPLIPDFRPEVRDTDDVALARIFTGGSSNHRPRPPAA